MCDIAPSAKDSPTGKANKQCSNPKVISTTHLVQCDVCEAILQCRDGGVAAQQRRLAVGDLHLQRRDLPPQRLQLPLRRGRRVSNRVRSFKAR